ncbi:MAG TPA: class I SAM-dependent methyltransferase [Solirubrobacteraceae bacterium]|nr:class I SAM-dependent methyltransferase [Solirubrobacteraceae bacterium]
MDLDLEQETHDLEESHWWYRERRRMIEGVLERTRLPAGCRILDAGCGSGRNMQLLARFGAPTGVEPAQQSVDMARARGVGPVMQGSLDARLPFESGAFDLVVCLDVLEHIADDGAALRELRRVTATDGRLLVTVPAHRWLWGAHDELSGHQRRYTRASLLSAAAAAGWRPLWVSGFNAALLGPIAAARAADRTIGRLRPSRSDLGRTPRSLDRVLGAVLGAEARIIGSGRSLPFGVSIVALLGAGRG